MSSILQELYFDEEALFEKIPPSEEYNEINLKISELFEKLHEGANDEQKQMLDELFNLMGGLESETAFTNFKAGYQLCMQLVLEGVKQ